MGRPLDFEIRDWIQRYLAGGVSLEEFHDWFISATWGIANSDEESRVKRLVGRIQLRLAEYSNGHLSEPELRSALWDIFGLRSLVIRTGSPNIVTATKSVTIGQESPVAIVDITPAKVSG